MAVKWSKLRFFEKFHWNMPKIPGKMHMYDMVKIDTIVFEIVGGCLKEPGSDRVKLYLHNMF